MDRLEKKVLKHIREEKLIPRGSRLIAGFSGGADSLCLLSVLWSLRRLLGSEVSAVHVHHGLRGEEADRDAAFCRRFCEERGIAFRLMEAPVRSFSEEQGLSLEEAARILRYRLLREAAGPGDALIAVAHHADDQAETILMNLARGSGLKGLGGMREKRDGVIRPLLTVSREEILAYLERNGLSYVTDSTNEDTVFARNRIRHVVLPALKEGVNSRAAEHIVSAGRMLQEADAYFSAEAVRLLEELNGGREKLMLPRKKMQEIPQILRRYVIIEALRSLGLPLKDWGEVHVKALDGALSAGRGHALDLPEGYAAVNRGPYTVIGRKRELMPAGAGNTRDAGGKTADHTENTEA